LWEDRVGLTLGLRYDRVDRDLDRTPGFFGSPGLQASATNDIWLPKATIDLRAGPGVLLYATAGRGWRAGGLSLNQPLRPEKSWTYEAGIKSSALNNRITASLAVFSSDVRDFHDQIWVGPLNVYLGNVGAVTLRGADIDVAIRPARGLEFAGALGLTRARYDDYTYDTVSGFRFDGRWIRQVPDYDFNLAMHYRLRQPVFVRAEITGVGSYRDYIVNLGLGTVRNFTFGGYSVVNLRAGYDPGRWSLTGFVNNVGDRAYFTNTENSYYGLSLYPEPVGIRGSRRVVGVRVAWRF
jgi:iron complex outermembrane receptor protein